jgi:hypothetical protein
MSFVIGVLRAVVSLVLVLGVLLVAVAWYQNADFEGIAAMITLVVCLLLLGWGFPSLRKKLFNVLSQDVDLEVDGVPGGKPAERRDGERVLDEGDREGLLVERSDRE